MSAVVIRSAGTGDALALADLGTRTYLDHYPDLWGADALQRYLAHHFDPERIQAELAEGNTVRYFLVQTDARLIGFAKIRPDRPVPPEGTSRGTELEKIYLLRGSTGKGTGTQLLEHLFDHARTSGEPLMWLQVLKSNDDAIRLYERVGFRRHAEIPFRTDRLDLGMWAMIRPFA